MKKIILCALLFIGSYLFFAPQTASAEETSTCSGTVYGISIVGYTTQNPRFVYGYSGTALDYFAAICYDPEIRAYLLTGTCNTAETQLDYGRDVGFANWLPAEVDLFSTSYNSNATYVTLGNHYVFDWFYRISYPVFYTAPCITTPDPSCGTLNENGEVIPCPTPTPTPSPTPTPPTILVTEVGFTTDFNVIRFATNQPIDYPDGSSPTWVRGGGNSNDMNPVAYQMGTNPKVFAKLTITPAPPGSINAIISVKRGSTFLNQNVPVTISGSSLRVDNISLSASALEPTPEVKRKKYKFTWEISFNNGQRWTSIGDSGDHEIHWLFDEPKEPTFKDFFNTQWSGLYDEALRHSTGEVGEGASDPATIMLRITKQLANDIFYEPALSSVQGVHLLKKLADKRNRQAQCADHALLLRGLLRSIGIDSTVKYHWGGDTSVTNMELPAKRHYYYYRPTTNSSRKITLQVERGQLFNIDRDNLLVEDVELNPHFTYHATVEASGQSYDPSYGKVEADVKLKEAVDATGKIITDKTAATALRVTRAFFGDPNFALDTDKTCKHQRAIVGTGAVTGFNFDIDGITDVAVVRGSTGEWIITNSFDGSITTLTQVFHPEEDLIVPGDYDGDGKIDAAVWQFSGLWNIINSSDGSNRTEYLMPLSAGDRPVPGDYDGDSKTDIAGWIPDDGTWFIIRSSDRSIISVQWGLSIDIPVPGDYDGDRKTDLAVWRPSEGNWYILSSQNSTWIVRQWGSQALGDVPVPGDYDGDGITDFAVWRRTDGKWYSLDSGNDYLWRVQQGDMPSANDVPIPGDYDGDGRTDPAIWRASDGTWRITKSSDGSLDIRQFGNQSFGDIAVPSAYFNQ
jgi:hypothetical protein